MIRRIIMILLWIIPGLALGQDIIWSPLISECFSEFERAVTEKNVAADYPRPQMKRDHWLSLNGLWDFAIKSKEDTLLGDYDSRILVPFPPQSELSGVRSLVGPTQRIEYHRNFALPASWSGKHIMLHINASDWETTVYVNGEPVGTHRGGYDHISYDISYFLQESGRQELTISVWDGGEKSFQPGGLQISYPNNGTHANISGIWQSVWLEPVDVSSIRQLEFDYELESKSIHISGKYNNVFPEDSIVLTAFHRNRQAFQTTFVAEKGMTKSIENPKLWSPENPHVYTYKAQLMRFGKQIDEVKGYFVLKDVQIKVHQNTKRLFLNGSPYFFLGVNHSGYWPAGLYSAASPQVYHDELMKIKDLGFNSVRVYEKIENYWFYYWCDHLGLSVWQDIPRSDAMLQPGESRNFSSEAQFLLETEKMIAQVKPFGSIFYMNIFNHQYGTFNIDENLANFSASSSIWLTGYPTDVESNDTLFTKAYSKIPLDMNFDQNAIILCRTGEITSVVSDDCLHYNARSKEKLSAKEWSNKYTENLIQIHQWAATGLSGYFYPQFADLEYENNGLYSENREVLKGNSNLIKKANKELIEFSKK